MTFLIFLMFLLIYFLPSMVAFNRRHRQRIAILALNFLLGWTVLFWILSLVWSLTQDVELAHSPTNGTPASPSNSRGSAHRIDTSV